MTIATFSVIRATPTVVSCIVELHESLFMRLSFVSIINTPSSRALYVNVTSLLYSGEGTYFNTFGFIYIFTVAASIVTSLSHGTLTFIGVPCQVCVLTVVSPLFTVIVAPFKFVSDADLFDTSLMVTVSFSFSFRLFSVR